MFDIGALEFLVLGIVALFIFGPERLPEMARKAAQGIRTIRSMATNARRDFARELGPEFENLDARDLNPRTFVRKHLLDDVDKDFDFRKDLDVNDDLKVDLNDKRSRSKRTATSSVNGTSDVNSASAGTSTSSSTSSTAVDTEQANDAVAADAAGSEHEVGSSAAGGTSTSDQVSEPGLDAAADPVGATAMVSDEVASDGSPTNAVAVLTRESAPPVDFEAT